MKRFIRFGTLALSLLAATHLLAEDITVFAAASLTDSLKEIATAYEKTSGDKVVFNFGASSALASKSRQAHLPMSSSPPMRQRWTHWMRSSSS